MVNGAKVMVEYLCLGAFFKANHCLTSGIRRYTKIIHLRKQCNRSISCGSMVGHGLSGATVSGIRIRFEP